MKFIVTIAITIMIWASPSLASNNVQLDIRYKQRSIGSITEVRLEGDKKDPSRLLIYVTGKFNSFAKDLDDTLRKMGNFGSCTQRLFWTGSTSIRGTGKVLSLSSRARYEKWYCKRILGRWIRSRIFRDTKTINWVVYLQPGQLDKIAVVAELQNIKNFPNWAEKWVGEIKKEIKIPIPVSCGKCNCSKFATSLQPNLEKTEFSQTSTSIQLKFVLSVRGELTELLKCL